MPNEKIFEFFKIVLALSASGEGRGEMLAQCAPLVGFLTIVF